MINSLAIDAIESGASTSTTKRRELGAGVRCRGGIRMIEATPPRQLPVRLPPCLDELLSSWIRPARQLLCGPAAGHASALPAGGLLIASNRSPSEQ
jgi:hypothetical protein